MRLYNGLLWIRTFYFVPFARYYSSGISISDLDLSGLTKVKFSNFSGKSI